MTLGNDNPGLSGSVGKPSKTQFWATTGGPIAIVGAGCVFPGARNLDQFWEIIERGIDTSRSVPAGRWVLNSQRAPTQGPPIPDTVYRPWLLYRGFQIGYERHRAAGLFA
jgi:hypothetical protein